MTADDMDASKAPLIEHLVELRSRLIKSVVAFMLMFFLSFFFAQQIYNVLIFPYVLAAGDVSQVKLIYTAPLEYLFTQIKIAIFGASFFSFPIVATQIYKFVAPGLYKNEKDAFLPYLIATPVLFLIGAAAVFFIAMTNLWVTPTDLGTTYSDSEYADDACQMASNILWAMSGRKIPDARSSFFRVR